MTRQLFDENLNLIQDVISAICQRQHLYGPEAEDFTSDAHLKLLANDCEVLRKFQGGSTLRTYLFTVIFRHFQDYRNKLWGKYRPSTAAKRLGDLAVRLEMLVVRDGHAVDAAIQVLRANEGVTQSEKELYALYEQLPYRAPSAMMEPEESLLTEAQPGPTPEVALVSAETDRRQDRLVGVMNQARAVLQPEDRTLLKLRYDEGVSVANIARSLNIDQALLHRRYTKVLKSLKKELVKQGVDEQEVREILQE